MNISLTPLGRDNNSSSSKIMMKVKPLYHDDDDEEENETESSSCCSTVETRGPLCQAVSSDSCTTATTRSYHGRRRSSLVRFNEASNVAYPHPSSYDNDEDDENDQGSVDAYRSWYSAQEFKQFKTNYTNQIKGVIEFEMAQQREQREQQSSHSGSKKRQQQAYHKVLSRVYESCCQRQPLSPKDQDYFSKWIAASTSRVGLERMVTRRIRQDKAVRRRELVFIVLDLQEENRALFVDNGDSYCYYSYSDGDDDHLDLEEAMAQAAREISAPSRRFAQLLAESQWAAACKDFE